MAKCLHCKLEFKGTGAVFEVVCPVCKVKGHKWMPSTCEMCKPPQQPNPGGEKVSLKKRLKKAA